MIFGTPTRYGNMAAQMKNFIDQTGGLWVNAARSSGKIGSVFTSTATQHGGQETTITSFHSTLLHLGMILVGVPYAEKRSCEDEGDQRRSPYGASTLAGSDGSRHPSENELGHRAVPGPPRREIARRLKAAPITMQYIAAGAGTCMVIGVPKEIKNNEYRVGLVLAGRGGTGAGRPRGAGGNRGGVGQQHLRRGVPRGRGARWRPTPPTSGPGPNWWSRSRSPCPRSTITCGRPDFCYSPSCTLRPLPA